jgi:hypothetical protein
LICEMLLAQTTMPRGNAAHPIEKTSLSMNDQSLPRTVNDESLRSQWQPFSIGSSNSVPSQPDVKSKTRKSFTFSSAGTGVAVMDQAMIKIRRNRNIFLVFLDERMRCGVKESKSQNLPFIGSPSKGAFSPALDSFRTATASFSQSEAKLVSLGSPSLAFPS